MPMVMPRVSPSVFIEQMQAVENQIEACHRHARKRQVY